MPQGTLKYVRNGQQTLGCAEQSAYLSSNFPQQGMLTSFLVSKWFSGSNYDTPTKQQTKLKLQKAEAHLNGVNSKEDIKGDGSDVEIHDAEEVEQQVETTRNSSPPSHKRRRNTIHKSNSPKKPKIEHTDEENKIDVPKPSRSTRTKASTVEVKKNEASPSAAAKLDGELMSAKEEVEEEEQGQEAEEAEVEDEQEDEDEKPEIAAKARKKVLLALKRNGKDPYPDWKAGDPVPYQALCTTFHKIEMTTKRLEILAHCSLFLRQVLRLTPDDLLETVLLMVNKLGADYNGVELGIGEISDHESYWAINRP